MSADQVRELAGFFHDLSVALGDYRLGNWDQLSPDQKRSLENLEWKLLNYSSVFTTTAISRTLSELQSTLPAIRNATAKAIEVIKNLRTVDRVFRIATAAGALGAAIASGDLGGIVQGGESLYNAATE